MLDTLRSLDLYKKVPSDLTKRTLSGAVVSVSCVVVIFYLMFAELVLYSNGTMKTSIFVSYQNQENEIPVRINITVREKQCSDIGVQMQNSLGQKEMINIPKTQTKDDCNLNGEIHVKKTSGMLNIVPIKGKGWSPMEYQIVPEDDTKIINPIKTPKGFKPKEGYKPPSGYKVVEVMKDVRMNHVIHRLQFGGPLTNQHRWEDVVPNDGTPFRALSGSVRDIPIQVSHDYHLRLVPTTFIDQNKQRTNAYQYSYGYQTFILATPAGIAPPSILFRYEISPMEIKYQYYRKPMYHLLTMLCAIIGGVATVAGIIDKILFGTNELIKQKISIGKLS